MAITVPAIHRFIVKIVPPHSVHRAPTPVYAIGRILMACRGLEHIRILPPHSLLDYSWCLAQGLSSHALLSHPLRPPRRKTGPVRVDFLQPPPHQIPKTTAPTPLRTAPPFKLVLLPRPMSLLLQQPPHLPQQTLTHQLILIHSCRHSRTPPHTQTPQYTNPGTPTT